MLRKTLIGSVVIAGLLASLAGDALAQRGGRGGGWGGGGTNFSVGPGGFSVGSGRSGISVGDGGWGGMSYGRNYGYGSGYGGYGGYGYGGYGGYPGYYNDNGYGYGRPGYGYNDGYYNGGYYAQPSYSQPTYVQPSTQYASARYEGPGVAIHNSTKAPIHFALENGRNLTVNPGETQRLMDRGQFVVSFDRGGEFGNARYTLVEGEYSFTPTDRGLELYRQQSDNVVTQPMSEPANRTAERPQTEAPRILE
jgi:hypothetical protein